MLLILAIFTVGVVCGALGFRTWILDVQPRIDRRRTKRMLRQRGMGASIVGLFIVMLLLAPGAAMASGIAGLSCVFSASTSLDMETGHAVPYNVVTLMNFTKAVNGLSMMSVDGEVPQEVIVRPQRNGGTFLHLSSENVSAFITVFHSGRAVYSLHSSDVASQHTGHCVVTYAK